MRRRGARQREDALNDALEALTNILDWTNGKDLDDFLSDTYMRSAVERQFEIVAEALSIASRQDETLRVRIPEIGEVIGMRNVIAHAYFKVDQGIVWSAVQSFLPPLRERILQVLAGDSTDLPGN